MTRLRPALSVSLLAGLLSACVPNQSIRQARVAPQGGSRADFYLSGDRFAVEQQQHSATSADFSRIFGVLGLGGNAGIGIGSGQELGGGLRTSDGLDYGLELWWKLQLLGREQPRALALSVEASMDTRVFLVPYDPGVGLLLAVPLGKSDLLLNARYGYLWTEQDAGPAGINFDADTGAFLPSNGTFGEAQAAFVFDATAETSPYLGFSVRQYTSIERQDPKSSVSWRYDPVFRVELGLQMNSPKKKSPPAAEPED